MTILAIDIGGTKYSLAVFQDRKILRGRSFSTDVAGGRAAMMSELPVLARSWLQDLPAHACGVGFGGPVNFDQQRVGRSMHAGGWQDFPLASVLATELDIPCFLDNDANLGALGESCAGAGRGAASLVYVTLSTGIGAGILMNGGIIRGADSLAGELGHIPLAPDGPGCECGRRGCFEAFCAGWAVEKRTGRPASEMFQDSRFRSEYMPHLARGLQIPLLLLNPERIVIGGGIAKAGDLFFAELRAELARQLPPSLPARYDIRAAELGDDSVLWGAAAFAESRIA